MYSRTRRSVALSLLSTTTNKTLIEIEKEMRTKHSGEIKKLISKQEEPYRKFLDKLFFGETEVCFLKGELESLNRIDE